MVCQYELSGNTPFDRASYRVTMTASYGHFVASGFADAPAGICPTIRG